MNDHDETVEHCDGTVENFKRKRDPDYDGTWDQHNGTVGHYDESIVKRQETIMLRRINCDVKVEHGVKITEHGESRLVRFDGTKGHCSEQETIVMRYGTTVTGH